MAEVIRMPKLSDTMTEGVVADWHKKVGDEVASGELLAEIESDKATMEFESFYDGVLLHIGVEKGKAAPVDSILAIIGEKGEDVSSILEAEKSKAVDSKKDEPKDEPKADKVEAKPVEVKEEKPQPKPAATTVSKPAPVPQPSTNGRVKASPLAKRLAEEKGYDIGRIPGSGDGGRIIKRDVEAFTSVGPSAANAVESFEDVEVSQMRKTIARRLAESKFSAPHFYLTMKIDMDAMIDARDSINSVSSTKISFNDLVIKASAVALKEHPQVNAAWMGDHIRYNHHVHVGVAVAVPDGLLVPVVRFADTKRLTEISSEVKDFVLRANDKKLQPKDWEGNTFTVSNLGMFGIDEFTAIINPPDSCIMAVGGIEETPVVKDGQIVPGNVMKVTLSCDHRVVDGASGAKFLKTFKKLMENPVLLLGSYSI
ncbi:MAG: pyruvate dehydrogenase complex dihydrolipoamide acetyltransferase [Flavobacteriales bacterium]|nr:pyruvate dehydrogenase complex dihydrolipoamide acetyltransferase [Flavobacteriales bacterium]MCB9205287.1 pyruvate dehydrogenase complex dihydrolipoamide acetyltransferase [Flavobacteriales bacterium]